MSFPVGSEPRTTRTRGYVLAALCHLVTPCAHFMFHPAELSPPLVETKKQPALLKADAMKAAAGVFFGTYAGFAVACRKLSLGDPKKATLTQRQLLTHSTLGAFPRRVSSLSVGPSLTMMASQRLRPRRWQSGRRMKRCWQTKKTRRARSGRS